MISVWLKFSEPVPAPNRILAESSVPAPVASPGRAEAPPMLMLPVEPATSAKVVTPAAMPTTTLPASAMDSVPAPDIPTLRPAARFQVEFLPDTLTVPWAKDPIPT
ncbi:hypothetical protein D3C87_1915710 [compost metagenome]